MVKQNLWRRDRFRSKGDRYAVDWGRVGRTRLKATDNSEFRIARFEIGTRCVGVDDRVTMQA